MATVATLREIFREDYIDDPEQSSDADQLVSEEWFLRHLNRAEREAAQRGSLLWDESSYTITLVEDDRDYALNAKILQVEKAWYGSSMLPLVKTTQDVLDRDTPTWQTSEGQPGQFFIRNRTLYFDLLPTSTEEDDVVTLGVYRLPSADLAADGSIPEIDARYHEELLHWLAWRLYSSSDIDVSDRERAQYHYDEFTRVFGPAVGADIWRNQMENPRVATYRGSSGYFG